MERGSGEPRIAHIVGTVDRNRIGDLKRTVVASQKRNAHRYRVCWGQVTRGEATAASARERRSFLLETPGGRRALRGPRESGKVSCLSRRRRERRLRVPAPSPGAMSAHERRLDRARPTGAPQRARRAVAAFLCEGAFLKRRVVRDSQLNFGAGVAGDERVLDDVSEPQRRRTRLKRWSLPLFGRASAIGSSRKRRTPSRDDRPSFDDGDDDDGDDETLAFLRRDHTPPSASLFYLGETWAIQRRPPPPPTPPPPPPPPPPPTATTETALDSEP